MYWQHHHAQAVQLLSFTEQTSLCAERPFQDASGRPRAAGPISGAASSSEKRCCCLMSMAAPERNLSGVS